MKLHPNQPKTYELCKNNLNDEKDNSTVRNFAEMFSKCFLVWSGANVCQSWRSRKTLQQECLVANVGFDKAEKGLPKDTKLQTPPSIKTVQKSERHIPEYKRTAYCQTMRLWK